MRPISIRFKCFGPYVEEQTVDFSELNHIFAVSGETGSGKTTLLDAMCYALYGSSSSGDRGEFSSMRCQQAEEKDDTLVEFIFEENGRVYRFGRSYALARTRFVESYSCDVRVEDEWMPLAANVKKSTVSEQAESILHLNATQFRQIIILPQGKFESFLVADSKAKEEVLESIFDSSRWGELAESVYAAVQQKERELKLREAELAAIPGRYGCGTAEEMQLVCEQAEADLLTAQRELEDKSREHAAIREELVKAVKENELFAALDKYRNALTALEREKPAREEEERRLGRVNAAQGISSVYARFKSAEESRNSAARGLEAAEEKYALAAGRLEEAQKRKNAHLLGEDEHNKRIERKLLLENARAAYETAEQHREKVKAAGEKARTAERAAQTAQKAAEQAEKARADALKSYDEASREHSGALTEYRRGIAGELAAGLRENEPCPVCGSLHHPAPASRAPGHVSKERLDELEQARDAKQRRWKTAEESLEAAKQALAEKERVFSGAKLALSTLEAELTAAEKNLIAGIESDAALEREIAALTKQIELFRQEKARLEEASVKAVAEEKSASDARSAAKENLDKAGAQLEGDAADWRRALGESAFADEADFAECLMDPAQRDELNGRLTEYKVSLRLAAEQLRSQEQLCAGLQRPDINAVKMRQNNAAAEEKRLDADCARRRDRLEALKKDRNEYLTLLPKLRAERAEADKNSLFAERLRGDKGVGIERYVLGIMLTMILREANRFLGSIYGGRYRLHKAGAEARNKKVGLDLEIEDLQTGDFRGVGSLSGGEKFLVSLSLAIGLSAVVQMQGKGVHMDAMFVDEGFGSLHPTAVDDAVSILVQARGGNGIVGVITHVDQVVKSIGSGLEAVKGAKGNTLRRFG